jgi:hypothetical protein
VPPLQAEAKEAESARLKTDLEAAWVQVISRVMRTAARMALITALRH